MSLSRVAAERGSCSPAFKRCAPLRLAAAIISSLSVLHIHMASPSIAFSLTSSTTTASRTTCANNKSEKQVCRHQSSLFSTPPQDGFLEVDDEEDADDVFDGSVARGPLQTDGGVIMPEGGANPCVIKVRGVPFLSIFVIFDVLLLVHTMQRDSEGNNMFEGKPG